MTVFGLLFGILTEWKALLRIIQGHIRFNWIIFLPGIILVCICFIHYVSLEEEMSFLLEETFDQVTNNTYYRPVGGTVEIGENSKLTIIREVKEEINADITDPELLGVIENIFTDQGQIRHEIDFIYEAELLDSKLYDKEKINGIEGNTTYHAVWKPLRFFNNNNNVKLVPDGLSRLLDEYDNTSTIQPPRENST